jgi:hypothetical protein
MTVTESVAERPMPRFVHLACVASAVLVTSGARAQAVDSGRAHADALFAEGQQLMSAGQIPAACERFEQSQREDPKLGRLLNMAYCHQQLGKTATAWAEYNQAAAVAVQSHQSERETFARARAAELAAKLSFVRLDMQAGVDVALVSVDGRPLPRDQWAVPFPIDPGVHQITVEAPGHQARTKSVKVDDAQTVHVPIEPLDALPPPEASAAPAGPTPLPSQPASGGAGGGADTSDAGSHHVARTVGWVVGALGVAGLGVGTGFAIRAMSLKNEADPSCKNKLCDPHGLSLIGDATTSATISTVGFVVGLVGVAAGGWLILDPLGSPTKATARVDVYGGPGRGGIALEGAW